MANKRLRSVCLILGSAPGAEHLGFVALAAVEVVGAHWLVYWVSIWLLVSGCGAVLHENMKRRPHAHVERRYELD